MPIPGSATPTRNQINSEPPFNRAMAAVATPKARAMKMNSTARRASENAQCPDDGDHGHDCDHDPCDGRDPAEHELEQHVRGDREDQHRQGLAGDVRYGFSHDMEFGMRGSRS